MGDWITTAANYCYTPSTWSTSTVSYWPAIQQQYLFQQSQPKEGAMYLYRVFLVYAEDRKSPIIKVTEVLAKDEEDAKVKSGLMKEVDEGWDSDYLNFICEDIGEVKVKPKPTEVKNV